MATVTVNGLDEVLAKLEKLDELFDGAISKAVKETAVEVRREAIFTIRESSFGEVVTRYDAGGKYTHIASAEGDAPNDDTGDLVRSIKLSHKMGALFAFVYTELDYGMFLETELNRPWLEPALDKNSEFLRASLTDRLRKQINLVTV